MLLHWAYYAHAIDKHLKIGAHCTQWHCNAIVLTPSDKKWFIHFFDQDKCTCLVLALHMQCYYNEAYALITLRLMLMYVLQ